MSFEKEAQIYYYEYLSKVLKKPLPFDINDKKQLAEWRVLEKALLPIGVDDNINGYGKFIIESERHRVKEAIDKCTDEDDGCLFRSELLKELEDEMNEK